MFSKFIMATVEIAQVEATYWGRSITEIPRHQRAYTSRRLVAILSGLAPPNY